VQELYRVVMAEFQTTGYWPAELADTMTPDPNVRRKEIYPRSFTRPAGAVPELFWWGIQCAHRGSASPSQVVADDLTQFDAHRLGLERRWQQLASRRQKLRRNLTQTEIREAAQSTGIDVAGVVLQAVPLFGTVASLALKGASGVRGRIEESRNFHASELIDAHAPDRRDLVERVVEELPQLARVGIPIVIIVEDAHLADESLRRMIQALLRAGDAPILVIALAWPDADETTDLIAECGLARLDVDPLPEIELEKLLRAVAPATTRADAAAFVHRYPSPLAIELALQLPAITRLITHGALRFDVTSRELLPSALQGLYAARWEALPPDVRQMLARALICSPRWLINATATEFLTELTTRTATITGVEHAAETLIEASDPYRWIRDIDDTLRQFVEPLMVSAVADRLDDELDVEEFLTQARTAASSICNELLEWPFTAAATRAHAAALLVSLAGDGFCDPNVGITARQVLVELAVTRHDTADTITQYQQLLTDRTRIQGPDHPDTLSTRSNLAYWLGESGRIDDAITQLQQLLTDRTRVLGPDHPETLSTRSNLATALGKSGRVDDAITQFQQLLTDHTRLLGPDHPDTLTTRNDLAYWLGRSGRVHDSIAQFQQLLIDRTRVLGPGHPDTLRTRNALLRLGST
jgi:hypothetical protein